MPIFERPPLDTLAPARERWTPIYPAFPTRVGMNRAPATDILATFQAAGFSVHRGSGAADLRALFS